MAFPNTNSSYGSSSGGIPASGNQQRLALDNLIRRELKVGDPNDPKQIADALLNRFKDDPRAGAITQEAKGLPFLLSTGSQLPVATTPTSSETEWQQAVDDVDRDLQELTNNAILKDIKVELQGWASAIRQAITEGMNAARFSLDTRQRDKVFSVRRTLGDYARLARLIGTLTPSLTVNYRKFAQSLDEVSSVLLVKMGEALANVGFNGGRFLLQVPFSELQSRRDATIYALRNLLGTAQEAYGNDWQRGIGAYRTLMQTLEEQGQSDLRNLLVEAELQRSMDNLIQRAGQGGVEGLRQLGATAQFDVERFRRLIYIAQDTPSCYAAPPLAAFLDALLLFAQAFDAAGGFRLLRVARPPILFYGLYGIGGVDNADQRLVRLIVQRGTFADRLDDFLQIAEGNDAEKNQSQIVLDKLLYDVDRSIDLYAVGSKDFGEPEKRASAYGAFIAEVLDQAILTGRIELNYLPQQNGGGLIDSTGKGVESDNEDLFFGYIPVDTNVESGEIVARLSSLSDFGPETIAGLMLQFSASNPPTQGDKFVMLGISNELGLLAGTDSLSGKPWLTTNSNSQIEIPYWLKIKWLIKKEDDGSGSVIPKTLDYILETSKDGINWFEVVRSDSLKQFHQITSLDTMKVFAGLAVSGKPVSNVTFTRPLLRFAASNATPLTIANFDQVLLSGVQDNKSGEFISDWKSQHIPISSNRGEKLDFTKSYLQATLQRDGILLGALSTLIELLIPSDSTKEPWDNESKDDANLPNVKNRQRAELCIQKDQEVRWESLVKTLSTSLTGYNNAVIIRLLEAAINDTKSKCRPINVNIPPTEEESQYWLSQVALNQFQNQEGNKRFERIDPCKGDKP